MKRLTCIVFLSFFFHAVTCGQILDKKINLKATNVTLESILGQISDSHDIFFSYCKDCIALNERVSINRTNTSISVLLHELLLDQHITYKLIGNLIVLKNEEFGLTNDRAGKKNPVKSKSSKPTNIANKTITKRLQTESFNLSRISDFQFSANNKNTKNAILLSITNRKKQPGPSIAESVPFTATAGSNEMDFRMAKQIVQRAFEKIEDHFLVKNYLFEGYYKEVFQENNKVISIVDAAVYIHDQGYKVGIGNTKKPREKVLIKGVRTSKNYMKEPFKSDFQNFNSLSAILRWNKIKYRDRNIRVIMGKRQYKLDSVLRSNAGITYVVSTSLPSHSIRNKITYYIDALNHNFIKVKFEERAKEGFYLNQEWRFSDDKSYYFRAKETLLIYEFKKHEGKIYLSQCNEKSYADIYNSKTKTVEWEFGCSRTLLITNIKLGRYKTKLTQPMDVSKALSLQVTAYNQKVWDNYENYDLIPLKPQQVKDLEMELSLEEQYLENAIVSKKP